METKYTIWKNRFIEVYGEAAWKEKRKEENAKKREYKKCHRKEINEKAKEYYKTKKEHYACLQREYLKTKRGRAKSLLGNYKRIDKEKGLECTLTQDWIIENIFNSSCVYCDTDDWTILGCDRIDNRLGHTPEKCCLFMFKVQCQKKR